MKAFYKLSVVALATVFFQSASAQVVEDVVSVGPQYVNQVYYSLTDGELEENTLTAWDLAFDVSFYGVGIRANTVTGIEVAKYPGDLDSWETVDVTDFANWDKLHDDPLAWENGAFNDGAAGFDVGWGLYNTVNHITTGHTIFIVKFMDGSFKKLRIDNNAAAIYNFTYADIDGENEVTTSIAKTDYAGKNFAYYSLQTEEAFDFEPASDSWDLVFGKYMDLAPTIYGVTGIRQNYGIQVAQIDGISTNDSNLDDAITVGFSSDINVIGHDWKTINMSTFQWEISQDRTYIIKSIDNRYYKVIISAFSGSGSGNVTFSKEYIGDVVSVTEEVNGAGFFLYPNPISNDGSSLQMVIETYKAENLQIQVTDLQGRVVKTVNQPVSGQLQTLNLDIAGVQAGIYHVSVISSTGISTQKLVVR